LPPCTRSIVLGVIPALGENGLLLGAEERSRGPRGHHPRAVGEEKWRGQREMTRRSRRGACGRARRTGLDRVERDRSHYDKVNRRAEAAEQGPTGTHSLVVGPLSRLAGQWLVPPVIAPHPAEASEPRASLGAGRNLSSAHAVRTDRGVSAARGSCRSREIPKPERRRPGADQG